MDEYNRTVFENLIYCINGEPRLFRWHEGFIEWADPDTPDTWHVLPGQEAPWKRRRLLR